MPKPSEPDLFTWAPRNKEKVLPPGRPIFSPETHVSETKKVVADGVMEVVTAPPPAVTKPVPKPVSESPLADPSDGVVQFLERLADEYDNEGKTADEALARAIKVHQDYLIIGGHKLSRKNEFT